MGDRQWARFEPVSRATYAESGHLEVCENLKIYADSIRRMKLTLADWAALAKVISGIGVMLTGTADSIEGIDRLQLNNLINRVFE